MKVLVVDDSVILRKSIVNMLQSLGHQVIAEAGNGYEAIKLYSKERPDLVTMDITMPGVQGIKDGIEALKGIREVDENAKIVMITSHGEEELVMDAISLGAKGYILKPVTKEKIVAILEKL